MKLIFNTFFLLFIITSLNAQEQELKYSINDQEAPQWLTLMYSENPDPGLVAKAYKDYYKNNAFLKNGHTQYYKRWMRSLQRDVNGLVFEKVSKDIAEAEEQAYLTRSLTARNSRSNNGEWTCLGPIDFDKEAEGRSYASGAAHVYTVEQSKSNPSILYAGTATAGLWKSTNRGDTWELMTRDMMVNGIRSIEIDHENPDVVFFNRAGGAVYKSIDGGLSWTQIEDEVINAETHNANDIVMCPQNNQKIFLSSQRGIFRSMDGGTSWTKILSGSFQELEFHPSDPSIIYLIKQAANRTEFYKSIDGGETFTLKGDGWPGIEDSASSDELDGLTLENAYVEMDENVPLGMGDFEDFTIELKVKCENISGDPAIVSNKNWNNGFNKGFIISALENGSWKFNIGTGSSRVDLEGGQIADGAWHHLAVSFDANGNKRIYQDGTLLAETSTLLDPVSTSNGNFNLVIGQDGTTSYTHFFNGSISDLRIWDRALAQSTIEDNACYALNNSHPERNALEHYWPLNASSGSMVIDMEGDVDGMISGNSLWESGGKMVCISSNLEADEEQKRTEIAVTAANPNKIYALSTGNVNGGSGLFGIYVSEDQGESWTFKCCGLEPGGPAAAGSNINMMAWAQDGSDDGGQYYYDLALDVSPIDENKVFVAGVNLWISEDGGESFVCPSKWSQSGNANYVHADIHDIRYIGDELWVACDGGIFYSNDNAATFQRKMKGIAGTDFWGFGAGFHDGQVMLGGTYHNGTLLKDNDVYENGWLSTRGGDNIRGFVNVGNNRIVYDDGGKRELPGDRTKPFIGLTYGKKPNASYIVGESSNIAFHPMCYNISWTGFETGIWKTYDDGSSWDLLYDFGESVTNIEVSRTNPEVIYACTFIDWWGEKKIYRSLDGGLTWTNITPANLFEGGVWPPIDVAISGEDPMKIWIARTPQSGGYNSLDGNKVFKSLDGGEQWENLSTPMLDGEHLSNIEHQRGTKGGIYLGTRRAVYYRNDLMDDWVLYNNALPVSTFSTKLIPYYAEGKIRNGTNRSVHEADLYEVTKPQAQISADRLISYCTRDEVQFIDHSAMKLDNATWEWHFPGGTPEYSSEQHPKIQYQTPGLYSVSLSISNVHGEDSQTIEDFISVTSDCDPERVPGLAEDLTSDGAYLTTRLSNMGTSKALTFSTWIKPNGIQNDYTGIIMGDQEGAFGLNFRPGMELAYHWAGGQWYWSSGLFVPEDEWSHVALVAEEDGVTLYLNGVGRKHTFDLGQKDYDAAFYYIGSYLAWESRNYNGMMDEVSIWNKSLTEQEIRESMHLTKNSLDENLKLYYQFNAEVSNVSDRIGGSHANVNGDARKQISNAPVGGGSAQSKFVEDAGTQFFIDRKAKVDFENAPNGDVVVSHIEVDPDVYPNRFADDGYWVIHQFTDEPSTILNFTLRSPNVLENEEYFPRGFNLYNRKFNDEQDTWTNVGQANQVWQGKKGGAEFKNISPGMGQFSICRENILRQEEPLSTSLDNKQKSHLSLYPNPLEIGSALSISSEGIGVFEFNLYNSEGEKVKSFKVNERMDLILNDLTPGMYFYQILAERKIVNGQLMLSAKN